MNMCQNCSFVTELLTFRKITKNMIFSKMVFCVYPLKGVWTSIRKYVCMYICVYMYIHSRHSVNSYIDLCVIKTQTCWVWIMGHNRRRIIYDQSSGKACRETKYIYSNIRMYYIYIIIDTYTYLIHFNTNIYVFINICRYICRYAVIHMLWNDTSMRKYKLKFILYTCVHTYIYNDISYIKSQKRHNS